MSSLKHVVLAIFLASSSSLVDVFIYDRRTCELDSHLVVSKLVIDYKHRSLKLYSEDEGGFSGEELLLLRTKEYHIRRFGKTNVLTLTPDAKTIIEKERGKCK